VGTIVSTNVFSIRIIRSDESVRFSDIAQCSSDIIKSLSVRGKRDIPYKLVVCKLVYRAEMPGRPDTQSPVVIAGE
jgi:hypothetical protein